MTQLARFPFVDVNPARPGTGLMPYIPLLLTANQRVLQIQGLLDTGATISVLPYDVGLQLGFDWDQQRVPVQLGGNLGQAPAYAVLVDGTVAPFPAVRLAFAWTRNNAVPIILGQTNFFLSFDVTFRRKQAVIELAPAQ